jgi:hypothetical protein
MGVKKCAKTCVPGFAALCVAAVLLMPNEAVTKTAGVNFGAPGPFKAKGVSFQKPHGHHGAFKRPWFGGLYGAYAPYYFPESYIPVGGTPPETLAPYVPPPRSLNCERSRETVSVPSEFGGERRINVTRC